MTKIDHKFKLKR